MRCCNGGSRDNGHEFDYVTIKYSNSGVPIWTNSYDGPGNFSDLATAIAVDRNGNVFVSGYSASAHNYPYDDDLETIAYSSAGVPLWTKRYSGPGAGDDIATAITVSGDGSVLVAGYSAGSIGYQDYVTIKYGPAMPAPISLQIQEDSGSVVLRWENAAFTLQTTYNNAGMFTNIPGATTPYTNPVTAGQQFFRLISN